MPPGRADPAVHDHGPHRRRRPKFCAVLRDITHWKNAEEELLDGASAPPSAPIAQKSDFLAKISHEIRTPLNAIIGFSEVMMEERFGPIGNERYREYLQDIHASGEHLIEPDQRPARPLQDRGRQARPRLRERSSLNELVQRMRRADAAAGEPRAHHHPHLALADAAARRRRRALAAPDRAQPPLQRDQVHRRRRPGDRLDRADGQRRGRCCACATPASA